MNTHSNIVGGSTAGRTIACPGWRELSKDIPPAPSSDYANEGSMLHEAIAEVLNNHVDPQTLIGFTAFDKTLTEELLNEKLLPTVQAFDSYAIEHELDYVVEQTVHHPYIEGAFGTADIVGWHDDITCIFDHKFGSGVQVSPEANQQLAFYAACVTGEKLETMPGNAIFRFGILQNGQLETWDTPAKWVYAQAKGLAHAIDIGNRPDAPLKMGEHCKWCPGKSICPEQTGQAEAALATALDAEHLGYWMDRAKQLEEFANEVRAQVAQTLEAGGEVPGWKLVPKRAMRVWDGDIEGELRKIVKRKTNTLKISECFVEPKLKSPAQVEKTLKAHGVDTQIVSNYTSSVSSGTTLAQDDDPRPGVLKGKALDHAKADKLKSALEQKPQTTDTTEKS